MPADFSRNDVTRIAALAHLELDDSEIELFARQLADILAYATEVQQVDTTGVSPTSSVAAGRAADRADHVCPSLDPDAALEQAPDPALGPRLFRVPRVLG